MEKIKKTRMKASDKLALELKATTPKFETKFISKFQNKKTFNKFSLSPLNRPISDVNVCKLMKSFWKHGTAGTNITIVRTSAFGTKNELIRADGQHSIIAAEKLNLPLNGTIVELIEDTQENVFAYIATLNNSRTGWGTSIYTNGNVLLNKHEYLVFDKILKTTKLTISDLLFIFLGGGSSKENEIFKSGDMTFINEADSTKLLKAVLKVIDVVPNKAFARRSLYRVMKMTKNYNKFAEKILYSEMPFSENESDFYNQLVHLYKTDLAYA